MRTLPGETRELKKVRRIERWVGRAHTCVAKVGDVAALKNCLCDDDVRRGKQNPKPKSKAIEQELHNERDDTSTESNAAIVQTTEHVSTQETKGERGGEGRI